MTPGHTPGSMCYLVNGRDLFTGDSLSLKAGRAGLFNEFFNMDSETQKKSLRKLKNTPGVQFIYRPTMAPPKTRGNVLKAGKRRTEGCLLGGMRGHLAIIHLRFVNSMRDERDRR